jgi:hypothetical protein
MSKLCAVCVLPAKTRDAIDRALINGQTYKTISQRFKRRVSIFALCRHRRHLLPKDLVRQAPPPKPEAATTLLDRVESLITESRGIAESAKRGQQWIAASGALREVRSCLELLGKLSGQLSSGVNINFLNWSFSEDQLSAFVDAIKKRPEAVALLNHLIAEKLGRLAPITHIHFLKSDGDGRPARILPVERADMEFDAEVFKLAREICAMNPDFRERLIAAITSAPPLLEAASENGHDHV